MTKVFLDSCWLKVNYLDNNLIAMFWRLHTRVLMFNRNPKQSLIQGLLVDR